MKYSTERIVAWFEEFCSSANDLAVCRAGSGFDKEDVEIKHTIIDRLRAGDELYEAAKEAVMYRNKRDDLEGAIAAYEGREE